LAAKYGGGAFILVYIILAVTFGFTLMITEIAIGRKTGKSVICAFKSLSEKWKFLGFLGAAIPMIILPYYCVIGGWVTKYMTAFASGNAAAAASDGFFGEFIAKPGAPFVWWLIFTAVIVAVVALGVEKGIEKAGRIIMPILIVLLLAITVYALTLPGASAGAKFYLIPNIKAINIKTVLAAVGQLFYSMSLAMGIMVTFGSYMKKEQDIEKSVRQIEIFDTGVALLAGLLVIPSVFSLSGGEAAAVGAGPSLMFVTLPKVFANMGKAGAFVGFAFFLMMFFAALTSAISLFETVVSVFDDRLKCGRKKAVALTAIVCAILAVPSSLGFGVWAGVKPMGMDFLSFFDFLSNSVLMPIAALLTCIFVGFVIKPQTIINEVWGNKLCDDATPKRHNMYGWFIKYVAPVILVAILVSSILDGLGIIKL
jgi:NSS family neurotransmitter:Na+ symporter